MKVLCSRFGGWGGPLTRDSSAFSSGFSPCAFMKKPHFKERYCHVLVLASFGLHYSSISFLVVIVVSVGLNLLLYILPSRQYLIYLRCRGSDKERWQFGIVPLVDF